MANPWEEFQGSATAAKGPWDDFSAPSPAPKPNMLEGKSLMDLTPDELKQLRDGINNQAGAAVAGAADSRTFGFGDELRSAIGAPVGYIASKIGGSDKPLGQVYDELLANNRKGMAQTKENNPDSFLAGQVVGGITGGKAIQDGIKTFAPGVGSWFRNGEVLGQNLGLVGRSAKGALLTAPAVGSYEFGSGEGTDQRIEQGARGLEHGTILGLSLPLAGSLLKSTLTGSKNVAAGFNARDTEALQDTAAAIKNSAVGDRSAMRDVGAVLNPDATTKLLSGIDQGLSGIKLIPALTPKTQGVINHIKEAAENGPLSLDDLDQYRRLLRTASIGEDSAASGAVRKALDNTVNNLTDKDLGVGGEQAVDLLSRFRTNYTQGSKFEGVSDVLAKADGDPNRIKAGLTRFLNNADNTRGWNEQEKLALKTAASSSAPEKVIKMLGKFGIDLGASLTTGNTVAPLIGASVGASAGGAVSGGLVPLAGTVARQGQKYLARGKAENLLKTIEDGLRNDPPPIEWGNVSPELTMDQMKQIMSLPPAQAKEILKGMKR